MKETSRPSGDHGPAITIPGPPDPEDGAATSKRGVPPNAGTTSRPRIDAKLSCVPSGDQCGQPWMPDSWRATRIGLPPSTCRTMSCDVQPALYGTKSPRGESAGCTSNPG